MVSGLVVPGDETIVEFGPGTGPFTRELARVLAVPSCYLGVERNPEFVRMLRQKFHGLRFAEGSAEDARRYISAEGRGKVKAVVWGLPFASLPPSVQDRIIETLDALVGPGAEFRTFQYVHAYGLPTAIRFRHRMAAVFGPHRRHAVVFRNFPPAFVLRWAR
ncbi:MAG: SAM-dependent methyltransferase [Acidobacteria bacterium]|nr:MAG: SAM-dependent methyltransferase [Acidobacteriota bacterium]